MKPIHHAMVSARLFGGEPEAYLALHNAYDLSKAALPDMRHRAALHSVDHGAAVMQLIFPDQIGSASLEQLCIQHVNDDQGFDTTLDHWLADCEEPAFIKRRLKPSQELQGFVDDPAAASAAKWGGCAEDYRAICDYYSLPEKFSSNRLAPAVSRNAFGIFFSEMAFGAAITVTLASGKTKYVAVRDIGECITLARFGCIPTLENVFQGMLKKDWMMGSKVSRSRRRRCRAAGRTDLFDTEVTAHDGASEVSDARTSLAAVLAD
jgi:hypothetical protein